MTYIHNPIKYVGLENKRWTYQDFSAGSITGTSVTLTANERGVNEDGSPLSFDSSKIISSTALILRSDNDKAVQRSGVTGFLGKVKVSAHSGASVTLSHIPNSSAPIRIWYHYSELSANIKNQTAVPPMFTGKQIEDMEAIFTSKADTSLASVSEASSPTQITTSDTVLIAFGKIMKYITDFLTTFNAANKLVQLNSSNQLPALDGSQLTNLPSTAPDYLYSIKNTGAYTHIHNSEQKILYNNVTSSRGSSILLNTSSGVFTVVKGKTYKITLKSSVFFRSNSSTHIVSIVIDNVTKASSLSESIENNVSYIRANGNLTYIANIAGTGTSEIFIKLPGGFLSTSYTPGDERDYILIEEF